MASSALSSEPKVINGRYQLESKLGVGGVGAVYKALDLHHNRHVAIKRLKDPDAPPGQNEEDDNIGAASIMKEALILSDLRHPAIMSVIDVGEDEEGIYLVMELISGPTIDQVVQKGTLSAQDFYRFAGQVLQGLTYAHERGLQHRDLKPSNIMLEWNDQQAFQAKILDFGLAKVASAPSPQTLDHQGAILGSIYFMAPEQFERRELDCRTDLYAFGCVCYFTLTGHQPFQGDNAAIIMASHLSANYQPLDLFRPDISPPIVQWVASLMQRHAKNRPLTARTALQELINIHAAEARPKSKAKHQPPPPTGMLLPERPPEHTTSQQLASQPHTTTVQQAVPPSVQAQLQAQAQAQAQAIQAQAQAAHQQAQAQAAAAQRAQNEAHTRALAVQRAQAQIDDLAKQQAQIAAEAKAKAEAIAKQQAQVAAQAKAQAHAAQKAKQQAQAHAQAQRAAQQTVQAAAQAQAKVKQQVRAKTQVASQQQAIAQAKARAQQQAAAHAQAQAQRAAAVPAAPNAAPHATAGSPSQGNHYAQDATSQPQAPAGDTTQQQFPQQNTTPEVVQKSALSPFYTDQLKDKRSWGFLKFLLFGILVAGLLYGLHTIKNRSPNAVPKTLNPTLQQQAPEPTQAPPSTPVAAPQP